MNELKYVIYEKKEGVAWLTLNNPERYNALDYDMRTEVKASLEDAAEDKEVRVVVLKGAGRAFCAGADVRAFVGWKPFDVLKVFKEVGTSHVLSRIIKDMPKPVVAAVHGYCLGGGFELAMACDLIVAAEDAVFGQPEINLGIIPGGGGTQRLVRLIGEKRTKELVFTGDRVPAKTMSEIGVVNRIVPSDTFLNGVNELVEKIKEKSPVAIAVAKEAINAALETHLDEGLRHEVQMFAGLFSTDDQKEGSKAFLEKRKPSWKGK
jgi:enoyl-CoA hydratase/carnithine racemase